MTCELYCCLLPQCEALRICRSGFPIATEPYSLVIEKAEIFRRLIDAIVWLSFGSDNTKDIRDTLETVFTLASLELTFRQTSTMEAEGSVEFLDEQYITASRQTRNTDSLPMTL